MLLGIISLSLSLSLSLYHVYVYIYIYTYIYIYKSPRIGDAGIAIESSRGAYVYISDDIVWVGWWVGVGGSWVG